MSRRSSADWDSLVSANAGNCSRERFGRSRTGKKFNFFGRSNDAIRCDNVLLKVLNRQHSGFFSSGLNKRSHQAAFREVPEHLSFCLKEIVPYCYLQGHVFMGLSACGQFLISYKVSYDYDEVVANEYNFSSNYKYELYFWIYRPHFLLSKYFHVCLFDDHGVDDIKTVSITQWNTDQQLLIVHGASEKDDFDSYITVVRVPRLGCLDCKQLRDADEEDGNRQDILCIKCNMTIHTKYRNSDSGPKFNPRYNLNCPGYIVMSENSFIHTINIQLDMSRCPKKRSSGVISSKYISKHPRHHEEDPVETSTAPPKSQVTPVEPDLSKPSASSEPPVSTPETSLSIADQIIADFAEYETEAIESKCSQPFPSLLRTTASRLSSNSFQSTTAQYSKNFDELVITCDRGGEAFSSRTPIMTRGATLRLESLSPSSTSNVRLLNHRNNTNIELRIQSSEGDAGPSRGYRAYVTRVDFQSGPSEEPPASGASLRSKVANSIAQFPPSSVKPESGGLPSSSSSSSPPSYGRTPLRRRSYLSTRATESNVPNQPGSSGNAASDVAAKAYEFSEDNERCEKISTFRKRRLADKKYEFSEDSSHGDSSVIVPFNRLRSQIRTRSASQNLICSPSHPGYEMTTHLHRASPSHGFRSPCGSPVGNRYLRSPPGIRSPNYYRHNSPVAGNPSMGAARPSQPIQPQSAAQLIKMSNFDPKDYIYASGYGGANDEIPRFFIDAIQKFNEKKLQVEAAGGGNNENINSDNLPPPKAADTANGGSQPMKLELPVCSKKIVKIFVEEDDANSVVTTEEDDCISPGYHASLPMEVHGSCYSNMQIISQASFNKLNCPAVVVTQNSFDMEMFSFHVASYICSKNEKKYGILFDSAYELTHVCPLTETITCTMVLQFTASDTNKLKQCHNCSTTIDCHTHRKIYQCRSLFTWNMTTGEWTVLDYGNLAAGPYLELKKLATNYNRLLGKLRKFTRKLFAASEELESERTYEYLNHLRVLDSNNEKTKQRLVDLVHMIEFYRKQLNDPGDSDESDDDSVSSAGSSGAEEDANAMVGDAPASDTVSDEDDI
ncbi:uncharacterized protein LOC129762672 [Toxorhynchites rutilus septentrionalis]|uniref:uncharacterized protein LOC129762672 n=1 Tax=Toxorhynchites rutilus septentrionalis TaxID=329112 RepID=UPI00247918FB|nr:uncharacterized protein LOC129762672 [Toxorhynchites rutilus septentrionalis]XP_055617141.1 uncharacterized protein LOC129762672 [Toxorhynchites rutilus septentrionalis]